MTDATWILGQNVTRTWRFYLIGVYAEYRLWTAITGWVLITNAQSGGPPYVPGNWMHAVVNGTYIYWERQ